MRTLTTSVLGTTSCALALSFCLALGGCLAASAPDSGDEPAVERPIPVGPAVELPEPGAASTALRRERVVVVAPTAHEPGTQMPASLGALAPTAHQ